MENHTETVARPNDTSHPRHYDKLPTEHMNNSKQKPNEVNLLNQVDDLIMSKNVKELRRIFLNNKNDILSNKSRDDISLIELNEYVEQAIDLIKLGNEADAKNLAIRQLLN